MNDTAFIVAYVVATAISLAILYLIIRAGVKAGTTAALRAHEAWMRDGSLNQYLDRHAERLAAEQEQARRAGIEIAHQKMSPEELKEWRRQNP